MEIVSSLGLAVLQLGEEPSVLSVTLFLHQAESPRESKRIFQRRGRIFFFLMGKRIPGLMAKLCPQMPSVGL